MLRLCSAVFALTVLCGVATETQGQEVVELVGATQAEWQQNLDSYGSTHRIVEWDIRVVNNQPRYYVSMKRGNVPRYQIRTGRTEAAFAELKRVYAEQGYVFKKQVQYKVNGQNLYGGYWEQ